MSLKGKVAIVTGASRGIGAGIAKELARRGASVLVTYAASSKAAEQVVAECVALGVPAASIQADCAALDSPKAVVDRAVAAFDGHIDIIINNAARGDDIPTRSLTPELWDAMFHTNVRFPMFLVKESLPYLRKGSRIVNVSSVVGRLGWDEAICYGATKAAVESMVRTWAKEYGHEFNLTANAVNPGPVGTDMWYNTPGIEAFDPIIQQTPAAPRIGTPDDIAQIVAFLCEEGARWVTGNVTCANGGYLMI